MINLKVRWPKFIPGIGIIFCLIDSSPDKSFFKRGDAEKVYLYYHIVICGILALIF